MADFDNLEFIHSSEFQENLDQADLKFFCGAFSRLVATTEEQSEKCVSMEAMLVEIQNTLSQISNQLGIHPIDAEFSHHVPPVTNFSDPYVHDDSMEALLREMKQAPSIENEANSDPVMAAGASVEKDESLAASMVNVEGDTTMFQILDSLEEESIPHNQVLVSNLEHSLQIHSDSPIVCEHSQAVVGCDELCEFCSAYQVFDKTSPHTERLKPKSKRKLSLSPKTWMFKFKSNIIHQNRSRIVLHHALDSNIFQYISSSSRATFGCKWKQHHSKYGRRMRQTHMSKLLCNLRVRQDPRGLGQLILDDLKSHMRHKWKSKNRRAVFDLQNSPAYALDVVNKTSKTLENQRTFTSTPVASVTSLSFEVDNFELCVGHDRDIMRLKLLLHSGFAGDKLTELDFHLRENHRQEKKTGLLVFPWNLLPLELFWFIHLEDKVCLSGASNSWWGWLVFDGGKNHIFSGDVITRVFLDLRKCFFYGAEKRDVQTMLLVKAKVAHVDSLIVRIKELWIANMVEITAGVSWAELKWITWSVSSNIVEVYTKINDKLQKKLKQGMDLHGALGHCSSDEMNQFRSSMGLVDALQSGLGENVHSLPAADGNELQFIPACVLSNPIAVQMFHSLFIRQQKSSSIWHRWRRKDSDLEVQLQERALVQSFMSPELLDEAVGIPEVGCRELLVQWQHDSSENSWLLSQDFASLYPAFKLEDKLVLRGESIDTIHHSLYRKKKQVVTWQSSS